MFIKDMVFGYLIATGIETGIELGFWLTKKTVNGIYYMIYGEQEEIQENEIKKLHDEIAELKDLIQKELEEKH